MEFRQWQESPVRMLPVDEGPPELQSKCKEPRPWETNAPQLGGGTLVHRGALPLARPYSNTSKGLIRRARMGIIAFYPSP